MKSFFDGLQVEWVSTTELKVRAGPCGDSTGASVLTLAADTTIDMTAVGSAGLDRKTLSGTIAATAAEREMPASQWMTNEQPSGMS